MPSAIEQVHREYKDRGLVVLAVNIQESVETVSAWVRKSSVTMPVLLDPSGAATRAHKVTVTPTVFLVGRDGRLVAKALGVKAWTSPHGRALLLAVLEP